MLWWTVLKLKCAGAETRANAAQRLSTDKDPRAVEPLVAALEDADPLVRWRAIEALGQIGDPRAVEPLVAIMLKGTDPSMQEAAEKALRQIRHPRGVKGLVDAVLEVVKDEHERLAEDGLGALQRGRPWDFEVVQAKRGALNEAALEALVKLGPAAIKPLVDWLYILNLKQVGAARLVETLHEHGMHSEDVRLAPAAAALEKLRSARAVEPLSAAVKDADVCVRFISVEPPGKTPESQGIQTLLSCMAPDNLFPQNALPEAVDQLNAEGVEGSRALARLIGVLLHSRSAEITWALSAATEVQPTPELLQAVNAVAAAPPVREGSEGQFPPEIFGGGKVGWADGTHARVKEAASTALQALSKISLTTSP